MRGAGREQGGGLRDTLTPVDLGAGGRAIAEAVRRADGEPRARHHPRAPHRFKGEGPVREVLVSRPEHPEPHWHLVTIGLSELDDKQSENRALSGWGFELTLRLRDEHGGDAGGDPHWAVDLLANLAAYVWTTRHPFAPGHHVDLGGPIRLDTDSRVTAAVVVRDPGLPTLVGPFGAVDFLQVLGLTADELETCRTVSTEAVVEVLARDNPLLVTDVGRSTVADRLGARRASPRRDPAAAGGGELRVGTLRWQRRLRTVVELGAGASAALGPALRRSLRAPGGRLVVRGDEGEVVFVASVTASSEVRPGAIEVRVPADEVEGLAALFDGRTGWGRRPAWPGLRWHVVP
jgi:hypothetical protein